MGSLFSTTTQTKTEPWNKSQWQDLNKDVMGMYNKGELSNVYGGPRTLDYSGDTRDAMRMIEGAARSGTDLDRNAVGLFENVLGSGGVTNRMAQAADPLRDISRGWNNIGESPYMQAMRASMGPSWSEQNLRGIASGNQGIGTGRQEDVYREAMGPSDTQGFLRRTMEGQYLDGSPYLMQSLKRGADDIQKRINASASASGRYGSGMHTDVMVDSLGDFYRPAIEANYQAERGRQMGAAGQLDANRASNLGLGLQAANARSSLQGQNIANRMGAAGQMDTGNMQRLQAQLGAAGGLAGVQGANITNQANAARSLTDMYGQGLDRSANYAQLAPGVDAMRYADASRLAQVGQSQEAKDYEQLQARMQAWNENNMADYNAAARTAAILGGAGSFGTTTAPGPNPVLSGLGGAMGGAGLAGMMGMTGGTAGLLALLGGLGGFGSAYR